VWVRRGGVVGPWSVCVEGAAEVWSVDVLLFAVGHAECECERACELTGSSTAA